MIGEFGPAGPLRGAVVAPPDKSISHRAALLGAFGSGTARISRYLDSRDTRSTLGAVEALGASVRSEASEVGLTVEIEGFGLLGTTEPEGRIDVGNAGTLIRLLAGLLAGQEGRRFLLDGDESIRGRPMSRIAEPLARAGGSVETAEGGVAPLQVRGSRLRGAEHRLDVASAQVKSCLLLAGLLADGPTSVREPALTRDHTERMLRACGVAVQTDRRPTLPIRPAPGTISLDPPGSIRLPPLVVPGDASSAAFLLAAALLVPGSDVVVTGVGLNPTRIALLGVLNRMGAIVEVEETGHEAGEPVGSIRARTSSLQATRVEEAEIPLAIDELPLIGLLGCFAEGETMVRGAAELRHKESDRVAGVVDAINALGGEAEAFADGFAVAGTDGLNGGTMDSRGDHRLAMLGAVAGLASRDGVRVEGFEAAAISYPGFERDLRNLLRR